MKSYEKIKLLVQLPHNSNAIVERGPRTEGKSNTKEMCERDICFVIQLSHKTVWQIWIFQTKIELNQSYAHDVGGGDRNLFRLARALMCSSSSPLTATSFLRLQAT